MACGTQRKPLLQQHMLPRLSPLPSPPCAAAPHKGNNHATFPEHFKALFPHHTFSSEVLCCLQADQRSRTDALSHIIAVKLADCKAC